MEKYVGNMWKMWRKYEGIREIMLFYTWAVGLGKFQAFQRGGRRVSQILSLESTAEKRHETCQFRALLPS